MAGPILTPGLTDCPVPGKGNSSTAAKINPWENVIESSELREAGKKNIFHVKI